MKPGRPSVREFKGALRLARFSVWSVCIFVLGMLIGFTYAGLLK